MLLSSVILVLFNFIFLEIETIATSCYFGVIYQCSNGRFSLIIISFHLKF